MERTTDIKNYLKFIYLNSLFVTAYAVKL